MNCQDPKNIQYVFSDIVKRLMKVKHFSYEQEVATALGFSKSAFTERKRRNAVPMKELVSFCEREGINLNWILTGESGESSIAEKAVVYRTHYDPEIEAVIKLMEGMDEETKKDIRLSVEKEKLLRDLLRQKEDREAG